MRLRSLARNARGSVLVEFGLVAPMALFFMFAIMDFAYAAYTSHLVANAARIGVRYAAVHGSTCTVTGCPATTDSVSTYVKSLASGIIASSMTVTTTWAAYGSCRTSPYKATGCLVTVNVSYPYKVLFLEVPKTSWTMTSSSEMQIAQ